VSRDGAWLAVALGSALAHGMVVLTLPLPDARAAAPPRPPIDVAFVAASPPPPPPPLAPAPVPEASPMPAPEAARTLAARAPAAPPAAAARVLDAPGEAGDALVDFSVLQGEAQRFSGGVTAEAARPGARPGGSGADRRGAPAATGGTHVDAASPARPASASWSCSHLFPAQADVAAVHEAVVRIAVQVGPDGKPRAITVLSDPGYGFASAARACALAQRYVAARDGAGSATTAVTAPFSVRFSR
jgi:outer membrane biosynthesis protein TonB